MFDWCSKEPPSWIFIVSVKRQIGLYSIKVKQSFKHYDNKVILIQFNSSQCFDVKKNILIKPTSQELLPSDDCVQNPSQNQHIKQNSATVAFCCIGTVILFSVFKVLLQVLKKFVVFYVQGRICSPFIFVRISRL